MDRICQAHDCNNVIRSNNPRQLNCSKACKTRHSRYKKENGFSSGISGMRVPSTGNFIADISTNATAALLNPTVTDPLAAMSNNALRTCLPYALQKVKDRPFLSLFMAIGGTWAANSFFSNCTTTVTTEDGVERTSKSCKKASGLQKASSAAVSILGANYLMDSVVDSFKGNIGSREALHNRYSNGNMTVTQPKTVQFSAS